jgi:hypothetical protein
MAFVCIIKDDQFQADIFRNGNMWAVIVNVGYDDTEDKRYSAMIGLEPSAGGRVEFFYNLIEADGETGAEHVYWCGKDVAAFIEPKDRELILNVVANETLNLLRAAKPERVEYVTHDSMFPKKALAKHMVVIEACRTAGYEVFTADTYHGKRVWWMERQR